MLQKPKEKTEERERREQAEVKLQREAGISSVAALWRMDTRNSSSLRADAPQRRQTESDSEETDAE